MTLSTFAHQHASQLTATVGLVTYAATRKKLTPAGIASGIVVALVHMVHPWPAFFWLLMVFFLVGTGVTKIGHSRKAHLTQSATGGAGGESARSAVQVFANAGWACGLIAAHAWLLRTHAPFISSHIPTMTAGPSFPRVEQLLPIGIVAQYAAVAADTFGSELGILSRGEPFLITAPWRRVPRGTNGGVSVEGLAYGAVGSAVLVAVAVVALRVGEPYAVVEGGAVALLVAAGVVGSLIDSLLGALVQATVTDRGTGKVVEGAGGARVKVLPGGTRVQLGVDLLTNNGVNFLMAALASLLAMAVAAELGLKMHA